MAVGAGWRGVNWLSGESGGGACARAGMEIKTFQPHQPGVSAPYSVLYFSIVSHIMSAPATPADPAPTVKRPQVAWTDGMEDLVRRVVAEHPKMTRQQQVDEFNKLNVGGQVVSFTSFTGKIATLRLGSESSVQSGLLVGLG